MAEPISVKDMAAAQQAMRREPGIVIDIKYDSTNDVYFIDTAISELNEKIEAGYPVVFKFPNSEHFALVEAAADDGEYSYINVGSDLGYFELNSDRNRFEYVPLAPDLVTTQYTADQQILYVTPSQLEEMKAAYYRVFVLDMGYLGYIGEYGVSVDNRQRYCEYYGSNGPVIFYASDANTYYTRILGGD